MVTVGFPLPPLSCTAQEWSGSFPVPSSYKLTASVDKEKYFLGENVLVHFTVENTGASPFQVEGGGDYRGAARHLRFKVHAYGLDGKEVRDPYPDSMCMGGIGQSPTVKPGGKFEMSVPLMRYRAIEKSGTYRVTVGHDLGWKAPSGSDKLPSTTLSVTFAEPTPAQAKLTLESMFKLPQDPTQPFGKRSGDYRDLSQLRNPIYLPFLLESLKKRDKNAQEIVTGIASVGSPDATKVLIQLCSDADAKLAAYAQQQLCYRLPDPAWEGKLGKRNPFDIEMNAERQWLVKTGWRPEYTPAVLRIAKQLVSSFDRDQMTRGAFMLECVGTASELAVLKNALDKAITQTKGMKLEEGIYPRPRGSVMELMRAATILVEKRHAAPPTNPRSPGECALFLQALKRDPKFRPAGWQDKYAAMLQNPFPYIRELALVNMPKPAPTQLKSRWQHLLADDDPDVQIAACHMASSAPDHSLREPLLAIMQRAKEEWLLRAALEAAQKNGVYFEALEESANRLDEPGMTEKIFQSLIGVIGGAQGWGSNQQTTDADGVKMKPHWMKLLKIKRSVINSGQQIKIGDPALTKELFPPTFAFTLPDGKKWP